MGLVKVALLDTTQFPAGSHGTYFRCPMRGKQTLFAKTSFGDFLPYDNLPHDHFGTLMWEVTEEKADEPASLMQFPGLGFGETIVEAGQADQAYGMVAWSPKAFQDPNGLAPLMAFDISNGKVLHVVIGAFERFWYPGNWFGLCGRDANDLFVKNGLELGESLTKSGNSFFISREAHSYLSQVQYYDSLKKPLVDKQWHTAEVINGLSPGGDYTGYNVSVTPNVYGAGTVAAPSKGSHAASAPKTNRGEFLNGNFFEDQTAAPVFHRLDVFISQKRLLVMETALETGETFVMTDRTFIRPLSFSQIVLWFLHFRYHSSKSYNHRPALSPDGIPAHADTTAHLRPEGPRKWQEFYVGVESSFPF